MTHECVGCRAALRQSDLALNEAREIVAELDRLGAPRENAGVILSPLGRIRCLTREILATLAIPAEVATAREEAKREREEREKLEDCWRDGSGTPCGVCLACISADRDRYRVEADRLARKALP